VARNAAGALARYIVFGLLQQSRFRRGVAGLTTACALNVRAGT
jgi:hypothetical protein